ncbi:hypothetical protein AMURIS_04951 [Acetatifactor muris]|uniref:Uncharacterized protein n=1 Tax=Acetatifactor muris TaxID=879566 RepID=A0A2K4ZNZ0_9FIRM|nr:hypothetical protein AMURIS_04951 [Acetatifactor muris]
MLLTLNEELNRVVILTIDGLYTQIYDELYCTKEKYSEVLSEYNNPSKYKVVLI